MGSLVLKKNANVVLEEIHLPNCERDFEKLKLDSEKSEDIKLKTKQEIYRSIIYQMEVKKVFLDSKLNLIKFSTIIGTNTTYLSNVVNSCFGFNFKTLLNKYRVLYAKHLLSKRDYSLEDLVKLCGFSSRSILYTSFQKEVGVPPSHYKSELLHG